MITAAGNIQANARDNANNNIWDVVGQGSPVNGASGTGATFIGPGSSYTDTLTGNVWYQIGTIASPIWQLTPPGISTGGVTTYERVAHAIYSFAVDGGAVSTITPALTVSIPANSIMFGATINSTTAVTSAGAATVAIGTSAGSSTTSILAATGKASFTLDALINGSVTFAAPVKLTATGNITFTIATAALTAGLIEVFVHYVQPANA